MDSSILIKEGTANARMAEILAEAGSLLANAEAGYDALAAGIAKSQGDFIDELKAQVAGEKDVISEACDFFQILLQMMQSAETDFGTLDKHYAE